MFFKKEREQDTVFGKYLRAKDETLRFTIDDFSLYLYYYGTHETKLGSVMDKFLQVRAFQKKCEASTATELELEETVQVMKSLAEEMDQFMRDNPRPVNKEVAQAQGSVRNLRRGLTDDNFRSNKTREQCKHELAAAEKVLAEEIEKAGGKATL